MQRWLKMNIDWTKIDNLSGPQIRAMLAKLQPKLNKYIPHEPTPKQAVFMTLTCKEAFFGGAAGGGKSDALLMDALQNVDQKGYAAIIFRKSYADLIKPGALIDRSKEWLFQFPEVRWMDKEKKFEWREKYGPHTDIISILQFGYLENENDKYNYQGGEYQYAGFDELTHFSETNYRYLFSRLRRLKGSSIPIKIRGASNPPDDDQGTWVYNRFVNKETRDKKAIFIPAGMDDNPHLDKESYEDMLNELDPVTRARLRDGDWTVIRKGNMFKRDWFPVVESAPAYRRRCRFWDMAASEQTKRNKEPDYTVGALVSEDKGIFYIEDIVRVRKTTKQTEELQYTCARQDGYSTMVREEQEPGSSGVSVIDNKLRIIFKGYDYRGIRSTGSKADRASPMSAAAERGHICIVKGCRNVDDFFNEAESFPGGIHDDMVDAVSGAFNQLSQLPMAVPPVEIMGHQGSYWAPDEDSLLASIQRNIGSGTGSSYWEGL